MNNRQFANKVRPFITLIRPTQWIKNIILFLPLFFGQEINVWDKLQNTLLLFVAFCMLTSGVYIYNDRADAKEDRLHPLKRYRPIASGAISSSKALLLMFALYLPAFILIFLLPDFHIISLWAIGYILLNIAYTLFLKHQTILDVIIVACGFTIRLETGAIAGNIAISHWLIIMTFILSLFLAFSKRRDDLFNYIENGQISRKNIIGYNLDYLNIILAFLSAIITVIYTLYTLSPEVVARTNDQLFLTIPFVLMGIMRYLQIILVEKSNCNPTDILLHDRFLQLTILGWLVTFTLLIY